MMATETLSGFVEIVERIALFVEDQIRQKFRPAALGPTSHTYGEEKGPMIRRPTVDVRAIDKSERWDYCYRRFFGPDGSMAGFSVLIGDCNRNYDAAFFKAEAAT